MRKKFVLLGTAFFALLILLMLFGIFASKGILMEKSEGVAALSFSVSALALLAFLILLAFLPHGEGSASRLKKMLLSDALLGKSRAHAIAYAGVAAALCIATNMLELKFATVQFSLTIVSSMLAGMIVGPLLGAAAVFLGDGLGYIVNSMGYPYYWWVALSCAMMAAITGLVMRIPMKGKGGVYVKLLLCCILVLGVCSVGINSAGMYYIGLKIYIPKDVLEAAGERFGGRLTFGIYLIIRFFLLGQIWNSLANYAVLFVLVPLLQAAWRKTGNHMA